MKAVSVVLLVVMLMRPISADEANPIGKVLGLIQDLLSKVVDDKNAAATQMDEWREWHGNNLRDLGFKLEDGNTAKDKSSAALQKATSDLEVATTEIAKLVAKLDAQGTELKEAIAVREGEAADFAANDKELADTVDTLGRAITILEREMDKGASFAQLQINGKSMAALIQSMDAIMSAAYVSVEDRQKLKAFMQTSADDDEMGAPAAQVYESKSGSIVEVLEDMKEKAEAQLSDVRKAESTAKHNFEMLKQSLEDEIKHDNELLTGQKGDQSTAQEEKAAAEGALAAANKVVSETEAAIQENKDTAATAERDYAATVKARDEEIAVIKKAYQLVKDNTGGAAARNYGELQLGSKMKTRADLAGAEVVNQVRLLAQQHHSSALAQLASRISVTLKYGKDDPFAKVKGLIREMISKLQAEAEEEANEKAWCDEQTAETEAKKADLESTLAKLNAKIDKDTAALQAAQDALKRLGKEAAELSKAVAEADQLRQSNHEEYVAEKADQEQALKGLRAALKIIKEYYNSFTQTGVAPPAAFEKGGDAATGIIGILEVAESDCADALADAEAEEAQQLEDYNTFSQESKITLATNEADQKHQTEQVAYLKKNLSEAGADKTSTESEHQAVSEYLSKVNERCIKKPETYEETKARREAEIKGLKQALEILQNEAALFQKSKHFLA